MRKNHSCISMKLKAGPTDVPVSPRSYEIVVGANIIQKVFKSNSGLGLKQKNSWIKHHTGKKAFLISDESLKKARKKTISSLKSGGWEVIEIPVKAGESLKDVSSIYSIYGELLVNKANRQSVIFALGGGTVGDAAGFVAATYLRGIAWVSIPTTLLSQVDSGIGGKTGINHKVGKNLIGSFHQPSLVVSETTFLNTLSRREWISGLAETVKYGLIYDEKFFSEIEKRMNDFLNKDQATVCDFVARSAAFKCRAVSKDEFDKKGIREALNFGHTFGHALESLTNYKEFQHGEAVAIGMKFAVLLSVVRKTLSSKDANRILGFLNQLNLPALPKKISLQSVLEKMKQDKKVKNGKIHFVLLKGIGRSISDPNVTEKDLKNTWDLFVQRQEGSSSHK